MKTKTSYRFWILGHFAAWMLMLLPNAQGQELTLDESCVINILNRTVAVSSDGTFALPNVPSTSSAGSIG